MSHRFDINDLLAKAAKVSASKQPQQAGEFLVAVDYTNPERSIMPAAIGIFKAQPGALDGEGDVIKPAATLAEFLVYQYPPSEEVTGDMYQNEIEKYTYNRSDYPKYLKKAKADKELQQILKSSEEWRDQVESWGDEALIQAEIYAELFRKGVKFIGLAGL